MNFYNYSLILLITTTLFIAFIVQVVMRDNITLKKYLENIQLILKHFTSYFKFNKCQINDQGYNYSRTEIKKLLKNPNMLVCKIPKYYSLKRNNARSKFKSRC